MGIGAAGGACGRRPGDFSSGGGRGCLWAKVGSRLGTLLPQCRPGYDLTRSVDLFGRFANGSAAGRLPPTLVLRELPDRFSAVSRNRSMVCSVTSACRDGIAIPALLEGFQDGDPQISGRTTARAQIDIGVEFERETVNAKIFKIDRKVQAVSGHWDGPARP